MGRREFLAYQLEPSVAASVRDRLGVVEGGTSIAVSDTAVLCAGSTAQVTTTNPEERVVVPDPCGVRWGRLLGKMRETTKVRCQNCNRPIDAIYDYCTNCGKPIASTA